MDIDCPEKLPVYRSSKRPPSIHAALTPDMTLADRDLMAQNPKLIFAHYEEIIGSMTKEFEEVSRHNSELGGKVAKLKTQVSDANKLLLRVQEEKEAERMRFQEILNKKGDSRGVACNSHGSTLKKCFTLEMSSNQTSDEDLLNRHHQTISDGNEQISPLTASNRMSAKYSMITESNNDEMKSKIFSLRAMVRQKDEEIDSLKSLNQNLRDELKSQKDLEEQTRTELIQHKHKRKECEETLKETRLERGQDKVLLRKLNNERENLISEINDLREAQEFIKSEQEDIRYENEQVKEENSILEKDKHILQCNMDKLNRMVTKTNAESKRYKSVIDLQKTALHDLQSDYNKVVVDLSNQENDTTDFRIHHV